MRGQRQPKVQRRDCISAKNKPQGALVVVVNPKVVYRAAMRNMRRLLRHMTPAAAGGVESLGYNSGACFPQNNPNVAYLPGGLNIMATELKRATTPLERIEELLGENARTLLDH